MVDGEIFKKCPMCATEWKTRDAFLADQFLELKGYAADFENLERGLFYFTHLKDDCRSTMTIRTRDFLSLYSGPKSSERRMGTKECPGYCHEKEQLARCDVLCECAFYREIIQEIKNRQKKLH